VRIAARKRKCREESVGGVYRRGFLVLIEAIGLLHSLHNSIDGKELGSPKWRLRMDRRGQTPLKKKKQESEQKK